MDKLKSMLGYIGELFKEHPFIASAATFGALVVARETFSGLKCLRRYVFRFSTDVWKKYGSKDAWAVVTGGSDPLAVAHAKALAKAGFNILLIGRKPELELAVRESITSMNEKVKVVYISHDFKQPYQEDKYEDIEKALEDKDVAILINGEEKLHCFPYESFPTDSIKESVFCNIHSMTYMTRIVVPGMLKRKGRSAIVSLSSSMTHKPIPFCGMFLGAKAYIKALMNCLALEFEGKNIDTLHAQIGPVTTGKTAWWEINVDKVASDVLGSLGYKRQTHGSLRHMLYAKLPWTNSYCSKVGEELKKKFEKDA